jgi:hypothetical protein
MISSAGMPEHLDAVSIGNPSSIIAMATYISLFCTFANTAPFNFVDRSFYGVCHFGFRSKAPSIL